MTAPVEISRNAQPSNLWTVADFREFAAAVTGHGSLACGVRAWMDRNHAAYVIKADGSLVSYRDLPNGKTVKRTFKAGEWAWAAT